MILQAIYSLPIKPQYGWLGIQNLETIEMKYNVKIPNMGLDKRENMSLGGL